ncbi:MAG: hypothetical protein RR452_08345, partial [Clostridia bacterium]
RIWDDTGRLGYGVEEALALKDAGYTPGDVMTVDQERRYLSLKQAIAQEAFAENEVFGSEEYDTEDKIYQAIENEKQGKIIKPSKKETIISELLEKEMIQNPALAEAFQKFSPYKQ